MFGVFKLDRPRAATRPDRTQSSEAAKEAAKTTKSADDGSPQTLTANLAGKETVSAQEETQTESETRSTVPTTVVSKDKRSTHAGGGVASAAGRGGNTKKAVPVYSNQRFSMPNHSKSRWTVASRKTGNPKPVDGNDSMAPKEGLLVTEGPLTGNTAN